MTPEFATATGGLDVDRIRQDLATRAVGRRLWLYGEVGSTNEVLRGLVRTGAPEGAVVVADAQTAGRGRRGQPWFSPPGVNLYLSVLCRPRIRVAEVPVFAFVAPLAVADAIREAGGRPAIKWPNDVLVDRRKVAGVRAELSASGDVVESVILGLGVNLNVTRAAMTAALGEAAHAATSLAEVVGRPVDRNGFAGTLLNSLEEWIAIHAEQGPAPVLRTWQDLDIVTGRRVEIRDRGGIVEGRALGVDAHGHLLVEDAHGSLHAVVDGDVRLVE